MAHNKSTTAWLLSPRNHTGPNHEGFRKLLAILAQHGNFDQTRALRAWNKVRGERAELELKQSVQGDSSLGLDGVLDVPNHLYHKYSVQLGKWYIGA